MPSLQSPQGPQRPPAIRLDFKSQARTTPATLGDTPAIANPQLAPAGTDAHRPTARVNSPLGLPAMMAWGALPSLPDYHKAVGRIEQGIQADLELQDTSVKRPLYLRQNYQPYLKAQPEPTEKGTVVMLHGYTAGPWQYNDSSQDFFEAGYNVLVPRIPGHGFMKPDGTPTGEKMIGQDNISEYDRFVDEIYDQVKDLGGPVQLVGLSGGSNLALRMAERHPDIKGVVAMAPYIGPNEAVKPLAKAFQFLDRFGPLRPNHLLQLKDYNVNNRTTPDFDMPHTQGTFDNATAMLYVGSNVDKVTVPVQFITTEGDQLSGTGAVGKLFERSGGAERNGWYHFQAEDKVPHAMASHQQNTEPGRYAELWQMTFQMIDQGALTSRPPAQRK